MELGLGGIGPSPSRAWLSRSAISTAFSIAGKHNARLLLLESCAWKVSQVTADHCFNKSVA